MGVGVSPGSSAVAVAVAVVGGFVGAFVGAAPGAVLEAAVVPTVAVAAGAAAPTGAPDTLAELAVAVELLTAWLIVAAGAPPQATRPVMSKPGSIPRHRAIGSCPSPAPCRVILSLCAYHSLRYPGRNSFRGVVRLSKKEIDSGYE